MSVFFGLPDAASKHAVQAFFDCLRAEVQEYGISVSTISHTFIGSPPPAEESPEPESPPPGRPELGFSVVNYFYSIFITLLKY